MIFHDALSSHRQTLLHKLLTFVFSTFLESLDCCVGSHLTNQRLCTYTDTTKKSFQRMLCWRECCVLHTLWLFAWMLILQMGEISQGSRLDEGTETHGRRVNNKARKRKKHFVFFCLENKYAGHFKINDRCRLFLQLIAMEIVEKTNKQTEPNCIWKRFQQRPGEDGVGWSIRRETGWEELYSSGWDIFCFAVCPERKNKKAIVTVDPWIPWLGSPSYIVSIYRTTNWPWSLAR